MGKFKNFPGTNPAYLYLVTIFFILHGFTAYYGQVPIKAAVLLGLKYMLASLVITLVFYFLYRNLQKASLIAFFLMAYNFFFGPAHDLLKKVFKESFLVKYTFILPVSAIILLIIIILLKKSTRNFIKLSKYLNLLFLLFIVVDIGNLFIKSNKKTTTSVIKFPKELSDCDTCVKPDIYLIVADEYANNKQLKEILQFENMQFEKNLITRGFHIIQNSKSNYNSTPFSIASLLTMDFIDSLGDRFNDRSLNTSFNQINNNAVTSWLKNQGYQIKNHSAFHLAGIPNPVNSTFFTTGTDLFTRHTLTGRFNSDLRWNFITRFKIKSEIKKFVQVRLNNTTTLINKTIREANSKSNTPRFVYLHTMMPHFPYLIDKNGNADYKASFLESNRFNTSAYLGYLQYSNKVFIDLIDKIQKGSPNAIIIFMGDHGFRHLEGNDEGHFMSFNSIFLPAKNYTRFYDGMSMVNEFRVLLNTQFNQHLPLLKDSTIFLKNWW